jgi:hypothetical protein
MHINRPLLGILLFSFSQFLLCETRITCNSAEGYAYYFEVGAVPKGKGGWMEDKMSLQGLCSSQ